MEAFRDSVIANLATEFLMVLFGVIVANKIQRWYKQRRYGDWRMILFPVEPVSGKAIQQPILERKLSADTAQRILNDDTEFDVFVKGRISPFFDVNCDLVTERDSGNSKVISRDDAKRTITVYARSPELTPRGAKQNNR